MPLPRTSRLQQAVPLLACLLVIKVTVAVVLGYRNYLPPNFSSDFLHGRADYFFGHYQWAFYPHIASGPVTLILGMILISERFRRRYPGWHRTLGKFQVATILLLVTPSGFWMAWYAEAGNIAAVSFALLACLTGLCAALGWRAAVQRRFIVHRRWMWRCYLLLCSAVVLRVFGGFATFIGFHALWYDWVTAWASWLLPLGAFELITLLKRRKKTKLAREVRSYSRPQITSLPDSLQS